MHPNVHYRQEANVTNGKYCISQVRRMEPLQKHVLDNRFFLAQTTESRGSLVKQKERTKIRKISKGKITVKKEQETGNIRKTKRKRELK